MAAWVPVPTSIIRCIGFSRNIQYPAFNGAYNYGWSVVAPFSTRPGTMQAVLGDATGLLYAMDTSLVTRYINRPNTQARSFQNTLPARRDIRTAASG